MTDHKMPPDLFEALADFGELDRLRQERRRAARISVEAYARSDEELRVAFETVELHVAEGLTLTASASLAGVTSRTLAGWIRLADDRRQPWADWFDGLVRWDAHRRRKVLRELRKLAAVDARALRDLSAHLGRPSPLEYEIERLRRSKTVALDVLLMPGDAERNRKDEAKSSEPAAQKGRPFP
jgi:hypothetical protein